ncbi:group-specific protein [Peribacillus deserti]|uniref:Group-specific protein n=1 Tax=Peribacillus deserti TaxID=673318 RepID=A0A2N5LZR1_9BACI|nr:group-specific protein [Peribacillus deserti]PLT27513.1 group-specific protein [Peribacillus deserti]
MNFYIASGFSNKENVRHVAALLQEKGHRQTYDWTQNVRASTLNDLKRIGELEKTAVIESDFFIILLPAGVGSHIEAGIALGLGKRVFIYSPSQELFSFEKTSTFYYIEGVQRYTGTLDSFVLSVLRELT